MFSLIQSTTIAFKMKIVFFAYGRLSSAVESQVLIGRNTGDDEGRGDNDTRDNEGCGDNGTRGNEGRGGNNLIGNRK